MAVRRERVILELQDNFSTGMAKAAAATALLDKELDGLSKEAVQSSKATRSVERDVDGLGKTAKRTEKDIDRLSGRIRILADVAAILGPTIAPIGAVTAAAIGGLASQLAIATVGAGTMVLAFQGVGDTLKAVSKADLEPTTANLEAARIAMERLSPAARSFVRELGQLKPQMKELRDLAATGLFPGLERGLEGLEGAWPRVEKIISAISTEFGDIGGDVGESFGSERWAPFLDFLAEEGPAALRDFATATGNTAHALAGLWMATTPLNRDFSNFLVEATADFDRWANSLSQTEGFQEFVDYIRETGPKVGETLGSIANALLQIVEATAPLGGPTLRIIEAFADAVATIADSPLGTPLVTAISAMSALSLATRAYQGVQRATFGSAGLGSIKATAAALTTVTTAQQRATMSAQQLARAEAQRNAAISSGLGSLKRNAALLGGFALVGTGAADSLGLANTASLALAGSIAGPYGAAIGGGIGLVKDLTSANGDLEQSVKDVNKAIDAGDLDAANAGIAAMKANLEDFRDLDGIGDAAGSFLKQFGSAVTNPKSLFSGGLDGQAQRDIEDAQAKLDAAAQSAADLQSQMDLRTAGKFASEGLDVTKAGLDGATMSADEFSDSLIRANEILTGRSAARDYQAALDDFSQGLKDNGKTLDINTEKGRKNQANLDAIAGSALKLAEQIQNPVLRSKFLDNARAEFIKAQVAAGKSREAAKKLADQVGLLNQVKGTPKIDASQIDNAITKAETLRGLLNGLGLNRNTVPFLDKFNLPGDPTKKAAGGMIYGPGTATSDSVPAMLSTGEYVVRAAAVDKYGPGFFDAANQMRLATGGRVPGLNNFIREDLDMRVPTTLKGWNAALAMSTKLLEKERDKRQALLDQADSVRSSIRGNYRSDLFRDQPSSVWLSNADRMKAGTGDVFSTLTGDLSSLGALSSATAQLKKKGLDGAALADLLSNASLQQVQAFASGSAADVLRYESLYNQRERALITTGNVGANAAFGPQIAAATAQVRATAEFTKAIDRLDKRVDGVVKAIKGVAPRRGGRG